MQIKFMTLDGREDRDSFLEEWSKSGSREATFLQAGNCVYITPYGQPSHSVEAQPKVEKFSGTYRSHRAVQRDFEITKKILGGGYLWLSEDRTDCRFTEESHSFGMVPDLDKVIKAIKAKLLHSK